MSKIDAFETDILELVFLNTDLAAIGDATGLQGSTAAGSFYIALLTGTPTDSGGMSLEADYTGYARQAVARGGAQWSVTGGVASNDNVITFAECTGGSNTITYFAICKADVEGVEDAIYYGALAASRVVSSGITPSFAAGAITVTEG